MPEPIRTEATFAASGWRCDEVLSALLEDFKWMLEQHPEHDGTYAQERIAQAESMLRGEGDV